LSCDILWRQKKVLLSKGKRVKLKLIMNVFKGSFRIFETEIVASSRDIWILDVWHLILKYFSQ
jgi:hypothetical protein